MMNRFQDLDPDNKHHRSTSRYSINRLTKKQPQKSANKSHNTSVFEVSVPSSSKRSNNKQNIMSNGNHTQFFHNSSRDQQCSEHKERPRPSYFMLQQHPSTDLHRTPLQGKVNVLTSEESDYSRKNLLSQLAEKDMTIMEYKNIIRRLEVDNKQKFKQLAELQSDLHKCQKQIAMLNSQNATLASALELMKNQSAQISEANKNAASETASLKKQLSAKNTQMKKVEETLAKTKKELEAFESLQPRLRELEELENKLIQQNKFIKQDKEVVLNTIRNVNKIIKSAPPELRVTVQLRQIEALVSAYIS